ncbi:MAG TPA: hypothetical protein VNX40_03660 [Mucilaginibacter sp.]|nr:hypothetical protein [Mucilaginibacter sp.]
MISFKNIKRTINSILNAIPDNEIDRAYYAGKIKKYSTECGCSTGAAFLFAAAGFLIYWLFIHVGWKNIHLVKSLWQGCLFIFLSALLGKALGIGIAKIRLLILYYSLTKKHKYHVNMYKMD